MAASWAALRAVSLVALLAASLTALLTASLTAPAVASQIDELSADSVEDPATLLQQIRAATLDPARALDAAGVRLDTGAATFDLSSGVLIPVSTGGARAAEMVFIGRGRARLEPPDAVEAGQLELFTGRRQLQETFTEAVFVVARDPAADALLRRPLAPTHDAETLRRASERYMAWKDSPERQTLGVETGILLDALQDPLYENYFAGWFLGTELGEFLLQIDPSAEEQINLGQFVRFEVTQQQRQSLSRFLHRQKQRGQLLGLEVEDLGRWDSWVKASLRTPDGKPGPGPHGFDPHHYEIEVEVDPQSGRLESRTRVMMHSVSGQRRVVKLELHHELEIVHLATVSASSGTTTPEPLFYLREGNDVQVLLPSAPEAGAEVVLEVVCEGVFLEQAGARDWALRDALRWYPRTGPNERATYDVTLRWPRHYDVLASGTRVDGGEEEGETWQRRRLEVPALGFSFEIGHFEVQTIDVGEVRLHIALDHDTRESASPEAVRELTSTVADALSFYQKLFGPYPLDELTVVTVPRQYSQALLGLVTLSGRAMADWGVFGPLLRVQDQSSIVAHEVAHQWWGHLVGWRSYRDQWISEAMANYAALLWARHRGLEPSVGPVTGWQQELTATLADGRPVESLGPLVLGERLFSSRSQEAYHGIVYRKGALVLEMLALKIGEENFKRALRTMVTAASGRVISTDDFLTLLEQITATDLDAFARQFIYGTGLPEIDYDYRFEPKKDGGWRVHIDARQEMPTRIRYAVVARKNGRLDVGRELVEQGIDLEGSDLVVPFEILLAADPDSGDQTRRYMVGRMVVSGRETQVQLDIVSRPVQLWLDRNREIFGRFFDRRQHPKRMRLLKAMRQSAAGQLAAAEDTLRRALAVRSPLASNDGLLDAHLLLRLAGVLLDRGRDAAVPPILSQAKRIFAQSKDELPGSEVRRFERACEITQARVEVRRGDYLAARTRLQGGILDPRDATSTEGYLLLAIVAQATGQTEELEDVLKIARRRGADVSQLRARLADVR